VPTAPLPVREQNLDADGNIKVHEQGVVSVSASAPLPVEQQGVVDVNVLAAPAPGMQLLLAETITGDNSTTSLVATGGCTDFIGMLKETTATLRLDATGTVISIDISPDGTTRLRSTVIGNSSTWVPDSTVQFSGAFPHVSLRAVGSGTGTGNVWRLLKNNVLPGEC